MPFVQFMRPDGSPVAVNSDEIVEMAPTPASGPLTGPLESGTRLVFRNQTHQNVNELLDVVVARIECARTGSREVPTRASLTPA